jgi:hypothetical protein
MSFTIETRNQAYLIFNKVEGASCDFAEQLLVLGVDRVVGRALAMEWASAKYHTPITMGQRGLMLPQDSNARKAMHRVIEFIWPSESATPKKATRNQIDPVAALIKKINALTPAQRRRIRAAI